MNHEISILLPDFSVDSLRFMGATFTAKPCPIGFGTGHLVNERAYYRLSEIPFGTVKSEEMEFFESLCADMDIPYPTCTTWRFFLPF